MFATVFALSVLASVSAVYLSSSQKGSDDLNPSFYRKYLIPAGQESGQLLYPRQFQCFIPYIGIVPPSVLKVEVRAEEGNAYITIKNDLKSVDIYRSGGDANSRAEISVSLACPVVGPRYRGYSAGGPDIASVSHENLLISDVDRDEERVVGPVPTIGL